MTLPTTNVSARARRCLMGVNLPWLFGAYAHDLAPNEQRPGWPVEFDPMRSYRPLIDARALGFDAVRVWLCENGEGIVTRDGRVAGVHEQLLESVRVLQECARLVGVRVYWTLLDGNAWAREGCALTGSIVGDAAQGARFAEHVAAPLARVFDPAVTLAVETINEPEALSRECVPAGHASIAWEDIARFVRTTGDAIRGARPGAVVTAGTLAPYLARFLPCDPRVDAVDIHAYHVTGGLPSRAQLARESGEARLEDPAAMPLFAGECGLPDDVQGERLADIQNYLFNAETLAYDAAFLWRLENVLVDPKREGRPVTEAGRVVRELLGE